MNPHKSVLLLWVARAWVKGDNKVEGHLFILISFDLHKTSAMQFPKMSTFTKAAVMVTQKGNKICVLC